MPTTVTKTIGATARDYATHALWISACPANLVTADQIWAGQSFNDSTFTVTTTINITGVTTDTTRYVDLDVGTGQGFASAGTPVGAALQSKGVLITCSTYGVLTMIHNIGNFKLHNHQITHTFNKPAFDSNSGGTSDCLVENCIFESTERGPRFRYGTHRNCLSVVQTNSANEGWNIDYYVGGELSNLVIVRPSNFTPGGTAIFTASTVVTKNCVIIGFTTIISAGKGSASSSNNATDLSSFPYGSSNQVSVPNTTATFVVATDTNHDFRLASGSALIDTGVTNTAIIPAAVDAYGTSRPQGSAWDIGFHEFVSSSSFFSPGKTVTKQQAVNRASTF